MALSQAKCDGGGASPVPTLAGGVTSKWRSSAPGTGAVAGGHGYSDAPLITCNNSGLNFVFRIYGVFHRD
ncbi:hypothetical protein AAFF_G00202580 [Aldrovandia affinis]|uniref:Uncharacterized protein n=1 Tax=Aldrovandia affinis TaxID=143900 RepID=A0AAD7WV16_9TELE|nr:hypothetical protein AAFF_G00202580 [Aldrovandia affinis]